MSENYKLPNIDHWGTRLSNKSDFFNEPKDIGEILSCYTTLNIDQKEPSKFWRKLLVGLFEHQCSFIGTEGFAYFRAQRTRDNIVKAYEINFNGVTDLLSASVSKRLNFVYQNTNYGFEWSSRGRIVADFCGLHFGEEDLENRSETLMYWINIFAQAQWTNFLLSKMESQISNVGHIEFRILKDDVIVPYFNLDKNSILLIGTKERKLINFKDINSAKIIKNKLVIDDRNFERRILTSNSGIRIEIPLDSLTNRDFFFSAFERLSCISITN